ncbi:recombinase family protein [Arthrobacter sp. SAFR-044]|uniref:recombinase family protein n=1 Tax=Arthrobacter sp. SAFR-044 TaxID=3387278 RepID=UPI003F7B9109
MSHETRELYRTSDRRQLALFASLARYERELITERVRSGVMAAQARGVKFGRQAPKQGTIETKLKAVRQLLADGTPAEAAEAVVCPARPCTAT